MDIITRQARKEDVHDIVRVHSVCFPKDKHFTTCMGGGENNLTAMMYLEFLQENSPFIVAEDNGEIIGFCMGYLYGSTAMQNFYQKYRFQLVRKTFTLLLQGNTLAWKKVSSYVSQKVRSFAKHIVGIKKSNEFYLCKDINPPTASLLSIGVLDTYQGKGVSKLLFEAYKELLRQRGVKAFTLSTWPGNKRAIAFYHKMGMCERIHTIDKIQFIKDID